jgi:hypothetical protein
LRKPVRSGCGAVALTTLLTSLKGVYPVQPDLALANPDRITVYDAASA